MPVRLDSSLLGGLRCFEAVARRLSFTSAANELHLTQSAVSQQVRNLEARLGYTLFHRGSRGLELTPKATVLVACVSRSFQEIDGTLRRLADEATTVQLNCSPSFALQWLIPRLTHFYREHPKVAVRVTAEFQALNRREMRSDDIHLAIRYDTQEYGDLDARRILDEYLVPVASPAYLDSHPQLREVAGLATATLLHDEAPWAGAPAFAEWKEWMDTAAPDVDIDLAGPQFNLASLALAAARNHQGVALARTAIAFDDLQRGELVPIFRPVRSSARYVLLKHSEGDRTTSVFEQWLIRECEAFDRSRQPYVAPGR